jgi:hypothetical protein
MSTLTINECGVQTILPLGVVCNVVDASTPLTLDGTIYLTVTGGSTPYSVKWSNGSNSQNLYSISAGTYTATVVDAYGDYTATTTCTVGTTQFYVDYFVDCSNEFSLYLTGLTETYTEGLVYQLSANTGCWVYSGKTLNGDYELTFDNIIEGPFETCLECDPPVIPPYFPDIMCLYTETPYTTYQFEFNGFSNGKPTYTGTSLNSLSYTVEWVTGTTNQWQVLNKSGNTLINQNDSYNPLGGWVLQGTQQIWTAVSGACPTIQSLTATISSNNSGCESECKGNAVITASGGIPPYQYQFDNGSYGPLPSKTSLCPGLHTYSVQDSNSSIFTGNFEILKGGTVTTYTLSVTTTKSNTQTNYGSEVGARLEYRINVTPALPDGVEISLPLNIGVKKSLSSPGETQITYTPYLFSGSTTVSATTNSLTNTQVTKPNKYASNYPWETTAYTYNVNYNNLVLKKGVTLSGYVDTLITKISSTTPGSCTCTPYKIYNPSNSTQYYRWANCKGGLESGQTSSQQTVNICACSVQKGSSIYLNDGASLIITTDGTLNCAGNVTNGNVEVGCTIGAPSINGSCVSLKLQTPSTPQLYSQLYQIYGGGIVQ